MIADSNILNNLKNDINDKTNKKVNKTTDKLKNKTSDKNKCCAATRIVVKSDALEKAKSSSVYIITEEINGSYKYKTFTSCLRTATHGDFCESHNRTKHRMTIKENKIVDENNNIKETSLVSGDEEYFANVKNKIKKSTISFTFNNKDDPIYKILNNPRLSNDLSVYAVELLKGIKTEPNILMDTSKKEIHNKSNKLSSNSNLLNTINELNKSFEKSSLSDNDKDDEDDDVKDDNIDESSINNNITELEVSDDESIVSNKKIDVKIDENSHDDENSNYTKESDDESDDEIECIEIYTKKNKLLYLDNKNNVIESENMSDGVVFGILTKIDEKYSTIIHDYQHFTVMKDFKCPETNTDLKLCVLSDKVFDSNLKHVGKITKNNNNTFKTIFKKK